jgi:hypothetical protein
VLVANFDSDEAGTIGSAVLAAIDAARTITGMPNLVLLDAATTSPRDLVARVESGEGYGAIYVRERASADLTAALAALGRGSYNNSDAIHFYWDEGRNPLATPRVGGAIRALLSKFCGAYALKFVAKVPGALLGPLAASDHPELVVLPVTTPR